jgi:actin-related protein 4
MQSFSSGKSSALVIDIGASGITISPILDGILLRKGLRTSPLGGNWLSKQIRLMFAESSPPVPLVPHYQVVRKTVVEASQPSLATYRTFKKPPTDSYRVWEEERVLTEFKESVVQVWDQSGRLGSGMPGSTNEDIAKTWPGRPFEMPDGWNAVFSSERYRIPEGLFDENAAYTDADTPKPKQEHTIPALVKSALASVDSESRPNLLNNIVVCGGGSLLQGLVRRIDNEVNALYPGPRVRVQASGQIVERKYASWIGGSILGSLGTFHQVSCCPLGFVAVNHTNGDMQMWISKKEYQEHGVNIIEKRCK